MKYSSILSFIIFVAIVSFMSQWFTPVAIAASGASFQWPLPGYSYMKVNYITGSSDGYLSDYPIRFIVHRGAGTDHGEDVYLNGHALSWPNDVRFTDNDGNLLNYWIESNDDNMASVWVKVPSILSSPDKTELKLFYGDPSAGTYSNGPATWEFFDDFNALDSGKWNVTGNTPSVSGGVLTVRSNGTNSSQINTVNDVSSDHSRILARVRSAHWDSTICKEAFTAAYVNHRSLEADFADYPEYSRSHTYVNWIEGRPLSNYDINGWSAGTWHILNAERLNNKIRWSVDYAHPVSCPGNYWKEPGQIGAYAINEGAEISIDWVCVGPVAVNEPLLTGCGSERQQNTSICPGILGLALLPLLLMIIKRFK